MKDTISHEKTCSSTRIILPKLSLGLFCLILQVSVVRAQSEFQSQPEAQQPREWDSFFAYWGFPDHPEATFDDIQTYRMAVDCAEFTKEYLDSRTSAEIDSIAVSLMAIEYPDKHRQLFPVSKSLQLFSDETEAAFNILNPHVWKTRRTETITKEQLLQEEFFLWAMLNHDQYENLVAPLKLQEDLWLEQESQTQAEMPSEATLPAGRKEQKQRMQKQLEE